MVAASKTLGPLHFEDLEPKRFEDLARQLIYDFKPWRRLEATGRAGSDDGFDARGYEMVEGASTQTNEDDEEVAVIGANDRLWLVQCKRERSIGPKKLTAYLDDIVLADGERLHGIVFTAACDFSKTARDKFRDKCVALGVQEWHLWGKAELEDKLMRPENDGLLFAYFGVSLTIRRRSQRTELRARLAMKRKANRLLESKEFSYLMLRSPEASTYPYTGDIPDFDKNPPWIVRRFAGLSHEGLKFTVGRYFAFIADDGHSWDAALAWNDARAGRHDDPWAGRKRLSDERQALSDFWNALPEKNQAWLEVEGIVALDDVLDIDELGDEYFREPHIYAPFLPKRGPFRVMYEVVQPAASEDKRQLYTGAPDSKRTSVFPEEFRNQKDVAAGGEAPPAGDF